MEKTFLDITVLPYRSLSKKGFRNLMLIVSFIFFLVGVFFWYIGAWPVFGFLGLDVLLLYYAFKINYKSGEIFETVKIIQQNLLITRNFPSGKKQIWNLEPYWTKVEISNPARHQEDKITEEELANSLRTQYESFKQAYTEAAKPDYIDLDKDGNKTEPMKKAAKDKEAKEKK